MLVAESEHESTSLCVSVLLLSCSTVIELLRSGMLVKRMTGVITLHSS